MCARAHVHGPVLTWIVSGVYVLVEVQGTRNAHASGTDQEVPRIHKGQ
jgi:hypothetical protein